MEPLAIIGIGCRFPHASSPDRFWELLTRGEDAIDEVPADRWDASRLYSTASPPVPGKMNTRWGGFVADVESFDPRFFGISPAEAVSIDPQQRWVLEVAHEALEDAGIVADRLAGTKTGVFVGLSSGDYSQRVFADPSVVTMHSTPGGALSVVANRLSYVLDLRGPSLVVDTACSSSLVALVMASRSLSAGETELAIVAGVNVILSPAVYTSFAQAQATSPDGRCKAFDASANGMVRGEGCGVVILKPLARAIADGDPVRAVLLGGAINQDGRTNGLTAPNRYGQEALLREAYASAGVEPTLVQYVEAHGTGTPLGDPIEAHALGAVVGAGRAEARPCRLGSVKTNIGHLEGAAGIAGVIKTALALEHRAIPPSLHFRTPSPHISFADLRLRVETELEPWPVAEGERPLAGVSAFGFGGTNAHVVLEAFRPVAVESTANGAESAAPSVLTLSTRSAEGLRELARATKRKLEADETLSLGDLCRAASLNRTHYDVRRALAFETRDELLARLDDLAHAPDHGRTKARPRKLAFVFPGMGSHRAGMGRELLHELVFADTIARCDAAMRPFQDFSVAEWMKRAPEDFPHDRGDIVQPLLFAFQIGLVALWRSWGLTPDAVIGGSVGEVAAAHVAGILELDDACRIVCRRSQLLTGLSGRGTLAVVELSTAEAEAVVADYTDRVWLAASNGPTLKVLAGELVEIEEIVAKVGSERRLARLVKGAIVASHSPFVESLRDPLLEAIDAIAPHPGTVPMWSTVDVRAVDGAEMGAEYWWRNMRQPVLFTNGVEALEAATSHTFLEIGAHPVMTSSLVQIVTALGRVPNVVASIERNVSERRAVREALAELYGFGHAISWSSVQPTGESRARLPLYPWARERHWLGDAVFAPAPVQAPEGPASTLPEPDARATFSRVVLEALPVSERESRLVAYMREHVARVLKMDLQRLDVDEPLNRLGIGSLMGMELNNRVKADLGVALPVVRFLQGPSIREIAQDVLERVASGPATLQAFPHADIDPERRAVRSGTFPVSFAQQRMWFLHRLAPDSAFYTIPIALRFDGALDPRALEASLRAIIDRHESLRTTFAEVDGEPVQVVGASSGLVLQVVDLGALSEDAAFDEVRRNVSADTRRPFDLSRGPVLRATLFRVRDTIHVFSVAMHHAVSDGGSLMVLADELGVEYSSRIAGTAPMLAPLALQYADYAGWQRRASPSRHDAELAYWQRELAGAPPLLALPTDRARPSVATFRGATITDVIPGTLTASLESIGRAVGATTFGVLLAAFDVFLWRFSGQNDVSVGTPVAGRTEPGVERLIGLFLNTLVVRARVDEDAPFRVLLGHVRDKILGALTHQDVPFDRVVDSVSPVRSTSHAPLFQVMLAFHAPLELPPLPGVRTELFEVDSGFAKCDVTVSFMATPDGLRCSFEYNTDLFDAETARRMLGHYLTLLRSIAESPDRAVGELSLLSDAERHEQHTAWNDTDAPREPDVRIERLVEEWARRAPDSLAVASPGEELTYRALDRFANGVAHRLRALGVRDGAPVAVCTARSARGLGALLGVLKAGAVYVPLDPLAPPQRLRAIVEDSGARIFVCDGSVDHEHVHVGLEEAGLAVLRIDESAILAHPAAAAPLLAGDARDLAYVVYTSGSTGRPKGVAVTHASLVNLVAWHRDTYRSSAGDRTSYLANPAFDASVWEIWPTLATGGSLHLPSEPTRSSLTELGEWLATTGITRCFLPTPLLEALLAVGWPMRETKLTEVLTGGDRLTKRPRAGLPFRIVNHYGPTECTVVATSSFVAPTQAGLPPIGRPIANTRAYVLDGKRRLQPAGAPGELYLGGSGLARGYWRDDALTAERFVPNPFGPGRLFRTGDRVRWNRSGELEFLGRIDEQVKIRGYRIEPAEIEAAICQHPLVREAVVTARTAAAGGLVVVAHVVPSDDAALVEPLEDTLRGFVAERLPEPMRPSAYVFTPALPLTPNGKVDRGRLPEVDLTSVSERPRVEPRTPFEEEISTLWGEVLAVPRPSMADTFFASGGHSLLALRLLARTRERFGVEVPLVELFSDPSLEAFARRVAAGRSNAEGAPSTGFVVKPSDRHEPFPLTEVQEAYWIGRSSEFALGDVASRAYVEIDAEGLDLERFEVALERLVERHDMLRAIVLPDGTQRVLAAVPRYRIEDADLRTLPAAEMERELARKRDSFSNETVATTVYPLWRVRATRWGHDRTRLHIGFDALVADATSMLILGRELEAFYADPGARLPPLSATFRDYVLASRAELASPKRAAAESYWRERLASLAAAPALPVQAWPSKSGEGNIARFVRRSGELDRAAWQRIKARGAASGLTPASLLLSAFVEVLATFSVAPRFTIDVTLFDRQPLHPDVFGMVGDFTALNLLEVEHLPALSFRERTRALLQQLWRDLEHRAVGGVWVLRELARVRGVAQVPMPVVFTGLLDPGAAPWTPAWGEVVYGIGQTPQVWLDHQTTERDGALVFQWDARDALFPPGFLDEMFEAYRAVLDLLARDEAAWDDSKAIRLLSEAHRTTLARVNATEAPVSTDLLHGRFLALAAETPHSIAVVSSDRRLTYGELAVRARALATRLVAQGVGPSDRVAIAMEKGWEQIVGVLGTLLAGAVYVPLDPGLPRFAFEELVGRSRVVALVTQERLVDSVGSVGNVPIIAVNASIDAVEVSLPAAVRGSELAYVIFTSGSTGAPKGVAIEHRAATNTIADINERFGVGDRDRVLSLSSLSFDLSVYDIFGMLSCGGAIVLPAPDSAREPERWARLLRDERITIWNTVPALMAMLLAFDERGREALGPALRLVLLSGDWIPTDMPGAVRARRQEATIVALGGATEAAIWSVIHVVDDIDPRWSSIPYGRPMKNQSLLVLDEELEERPAWVAGPLYIGGMGLARGYADDEATTRARFITRPRDGARLYRTGDLARTWPDGTFEILGREDFQVKIGGERIELGEIEATLTLHHGVRAAVVVAVGPKHGQRLVAHVVPRAEAPSLDELRSFLSERLADSHRPTSYVLVDRLPLTANGKIDRARLEATSRDAVRTPREARPIERSSRSEHLTEQLRGLVAEILELSEVDPRVDLLSLGIDSLRLVRLGNRLEEIYGHRPRMAELFTLRTVEALAGYYAAAGVAARRASSGRLLVSAEARETFKQGRPGVRTLEPGTTSVALARPNGDRDRASEIFADRRSARSFGREKVSAEAFGCLLASLREVRVGEHARRSYPSAGGLYPVQVFLHVKPDRIDGVGGGTYYHHPIDHRLVMLSPGAQLPPDIHYYVNVPVFDSASFSVFLVGNLDAIEPIYGELARDFCLLEAGAMVQVLMTVAPELGIDLCPIGVMDFERVRPALAIGDRHLFVHSLLGGAASETTAGWSFLEEAPTADPAAEDEWERITL